MRPLSGPGFIDHYIEGVLYPQEYTQLIQAAAALVVLGSWLGLRIRLRSRRLVVWERDRMGTRSDGSRDYLAASAALAAFESRAT